MPELHSKSSKVPKQQIDATRAHLCEPFAIFICVQTLCSRKWRDPLVQHCVNSLLHKTIDW